MKHRFTNNMREISGFGGSYEKACRKMVIAGVKWLDENPGALPRFDENPAIFGIILENSLDGQALSKAVLSAVDDCTGAMHHGAIQHILYIKKVGWDKYVEEMTNNEPNKS